MENRVFTKELASLMGITVESLRRRIRFGTIQKLGLECKKDNHGFYFWDKETAEKFANSFHAEKSAPKLSSDIKIALSIVRRIKLDGWPYDTDNETYVNLRPEAKKIIQDALNERA